MGFSLRRGGGGGGSGWSDTHKWPVLKKQERVCAPQRKLPSPFRGCDFKDGVVLIFLLPIFTLTSERKGKVAGMNFPVFSKQGKGHFSSSSFKYIFP